MRRRVDRMHHDHDMPHKPWIKAFSRPHTIQRISFLWPFYTGGIRQDGSIRINELLILPSQGKYDYYMHEDEWLGCLRKLADYLMKHDADAAEMEFQMVMGKYEQAASVLVGVDSKTWSDSELDSWFADYSEAYALFAFYSFAPWSIDLVLAPELLQALGEIDKHKAAGWYESICAATNPNRMLEQQIGLLNLAMNPEPDKFREHAAKYFWLPIYNLGDKPWVEDDFRKMLEETTDPKTELARKLSDLEQRKQGFEEAISEIRPDGALKKLIDMVQLFTHLRDERVDRWRLALYHIEPFYRELARRYGLTLSQAVNLFDEEVIDILHGGQVPADIQARTKRHAILFRDGKREVITEAMDIEKLRITELGEKHVSEVKELTGLGAYKGYARGRARLIIGPEDLSCIEAGEILVAHHTSPSYVMAMKRAVAIVTDEGGITSHAAIVSRELKIPCVTATREASSLIKTGDEVEVDAQKGIVRILKTKNG